MHDNTASFKSENPTQFHVLVFLKRQNRRVKILKKNPVKCNDGIRYSSKYGLLLFNLNCKIGGVYL